MAGVVQQIFNPIEAAWLSIAEQLGVILPGIIGFIIILVIGWLLSKLFAFIIKRILLLIRLNVISEKAGIEDFLRRGGIKKTVVDILGLVVYWFFLLITFIIAFNAVGLTEVSDLLNRILLYIPNIFVALVIMIIGFYLAQLLSASVKVFARNVGITKPDFAAKITNIVVLIFVFTIALGQLQISKEIITTAFTILMGTLGLGIAIAIGLGSKDVVTEFWQQLYFKRGESEEKIEEPKKNEETKGKKRFKWQFWKKE